MGPFLPVAEGVWRAVAMPDAVTIGLVAGSEGALVVDTGSHPDQGREILAAAQAVAGVPVRHVVVTHAHRDHLFGLAAFDGIESLGHDTISERLTTSDTLAEAAALGVATDHLRAPSIGFSLARTRDLGGLRVEIVHLGRGHTEGDLVVILPERGVIFTTNDDAYRTSLAWHEAGVAVAGIVDVRPAGGGALRQPQHLGQ